MDQFHIDLHLDYGDERFDFDTHFSSASSSRSFSTAPSCAPITPQSGRSTPHQHTSTPMSLNPSIRYELTPPASSFDDYFQSSVKSEHPGSDELPSTPSRKQMSPFGMDILNSTLPPYGESMGFTSSHVVENFSFSDNMASSPFTLPPPHHYAVHSAPAYENPTMLPYQTGSPLAFLEENGSLAVQPSVRGSPGQERYVMTLPYVSGHSRRQMHMDDVQQRSMSLHHVQRGRVPKRERRRQQSIGVDILIAEQGNFPCPEPECAGKKAYKRMEHMKRHMNSKHNQDPTQVIECPFCEFTNDSKPPKKFTGRADNYGAHLKRHTLPNTGTSRTNYHPGAQAALDALKARQRPRKGQKRPVLKEEDEDEDEED